jgi:hypothetical protein
MLPHRAFETENRGEIMSNLQKYGDWNDNQAAAEKEDFDKSAGGADFWKTPAGTTVVRFMPPRPGKPTIYRFIWEHYIDVPGGAPGAQKRARLVCPLQQSKADKLDPRRCPCCAYAEKLRATGNQEDYDLAGEYVAQRKIFANILVRGQEDRGVRIWAFGKKVYEALDAIRRDTRAGGNFAHPVTGFDIVVKRVGAGKNDTQYTVLADRKASPLHDDATIMDALLETMPDLDRHARILAEVEIAKVWKAAFPGAEPLDATPRGPAPTGRATRQRTAADDAIETEGHEVVAGMDD